MPFTSKKKNQTLMTCSSVNNESHHVSKTMSKQKIWIFPQLYPNAMKIVAVPDVKGNVFNVLVRALIVN